MGSSGQEVASLVSPGCGPCPGQGAECEKGGLLRSPKPSESSAPLLKFSHVAMVQIFVSPQIHMFSPNPQAMALGDELLGGD